MRESSTDNDDRSGSKRRDRGGGGSRDSSSSGTSRRLDALHRAAGNQSVQRLVEEGVVQPRLAVSNPTDDAEREAERVAEAVTNGDASTTHGSGSTIDGGGAPTHRDTGGPTGEERVETAPTPAVRPVARRPVSVGRRQDSDGAADGGLDGEIASLRGGGQPLPRGVRTEFEGTLGHDFGDVRVHTGPNADRIARSIDARAFTVGADVAFRRGEYDPKSRAGKRLLAHELTHVVQQGQAGPEMVQRQDDPGDRIQTLGSEDEDAGTAEKLAESTLTNLFDDAVTDLGNTAAKKVGSRVPIGAVLVATRKVAIGFAEAAAEAMKDARRDLAEWKRKRVQQSDLPKYAAMAKYDHRAQGKALAHVPTVLWEGLKGAFTTLVNDVLLDYLLGFVDVNVAESVTETVEKYAPNVANVAQVIVAKSPETVKDAANRFKDAFEGAAKKMASVAAAKHTGRSLAELVVSLQDEQDYASLDNVEAAVSEVIDDFLELRTETTRLVHEWHKAEGRDKRLIGFEFDDLDEQIYTIDDADVSQEAQQVAESVEAHLREFDDERTNFANAWSITSANENAARGMAESLEGAGKDLARLHEDYGWPVWDVIDRVVDLLWSLENGALSGYSLGVETDLYP